MCLVRLKTEGKDGKYLFKKLVHMMWFDVEERIKNLGVGIQHTVINFITLSHQVTTLKDALMCSQKDLKLKPHHVKHNMGEEAGGGDLATIA